MGNVRRIYVEKKAPFAVKAKELKGDLKNYLNLKKVEDVRMFIRYDVEHISDEVFEKACKTVFSEPPLQRADYRSGERKSIFCGVPAGTV